MTTLFESLKRDLKQKNIFLSYQRLQVLKYLSENQNHPTVDQIFKSLKKDISTLSKTTVYNTLKMLVDAELIKVITIEDNEIRYDIIKKDHGHFKCDLCGKIYDFSININALTSSDLNKFIINNKNVYFKGICPSCLLSINKNK